MLHFATIAPDLGLYMGRHLDKNLALTTPRASSIPTRKWSCWWQIRRCTGSR